MSWRRVAWITAVVGALSCGGDEERSPREPVRPPDAGLVDAAPADAAPADAAPADADAAPADTDASPADAAVPSADGGAGPDAAAADGGAGPDASADGGAGPDAASPGDAGSGTVWSNREKCENMCSSYCDRRHSCDGTPPTACRMAIDEADGGTCAERAGMFEDVPQSKVECCIRAVRAMSCEEFMRMYNTGRGVPRCCEGILS